MDIWSLFEGKPKGVAFLGANSDGIATFLLFVESMMHLCKRRRGGTISEILGIEERM